MGISSYLSKKQIDTVVRGLQDQGIEIRRVTSGHYRLVRGAADSFTMSLESSDSQIVKGARSKVIAAGLVWPLDPVPKPRKPRTKVQVVENVRQLSADDLGIPVPQPSPPAATPPQPKEAPMPAPRTKVVTQSSTVMSEWIDLTPALAEQFLRSNTDNRPIRMQHLDNLVRDMKAGSWQVTGDSIKFDINDRLIDGQHRLMAVVTSGVTIRVMLVIGLEPEAREVIDTNSKRSAADAIRFSGVSKQNLTTLAGAARVGLARQNGLWQTALDTATPSYTNSEIIDFIERNPRLLDAMELTRKTYASIGLPPSPWTYCLFVLLDVDVEDATEFAMSLAEFRTDGAGDARYALLNTVRSAKNVRRIMKNPEIIFVVFRAWNAWRSSQPAHKFLPGGREARGGQIIPTPL